MAAIENITNVRSDINEMLAKMRDISSKSAVLSNPSEMLAPKNDFQDVMSIAKDAVSKVNEEQQTAQQMQNAFVAGDSHVSMSQVVLESEKSKLAFEGLLAVRNKILDAYKEIMNMTV